MLYKICHIMLYKMCCVMLLYNICHVILYNMCHVLCYIILGRIIKGILERILERSTTAIFVTVLARFAMGFLITILEGILQRITTGILLESWLGLSSCFYSGERLFFVLEYGKTHFPGIYCFKKRLGKMAIF